MALIGKLDYIKDLSDRNCKLTLYNWRRKELKICKDQMGFKCKKKVGFDNFTNEVNFFVYRHLIYNYEP